MKDHFVLRGPVERKEGGNGTINPKTSTFWSHLNKLIETQLKMSSAYHPETDGSTNRTATQMLRQCINNKQTDWVSKLPSIEFARSLRSPPFSGWTPTGLWVSRMDIFLLYQCRNFPVTFQCLSGACPVWKVSPTNCPDGQSNGLAPKQQPQSGGNQQKVQWTPTGLQRTVRMDSEWTVQWTTQTPLLRFCILFSPQGGTV